MASGNGSAGAGGGAVYGIGLIGAAVYYFQQANEFLEFILALPKAIIWPGILVYELLKSVYS
jgi:hypothetical protein